MVILGIKILTVLVVLSLAAAVTAGVLAIREQRAQIGFLRTERIVGRYDSCRLIKGLVVSAAVTPKARTRVQKYISTTSLANCRVYSKQFTK